MKKQPILIKGGKVTGADPSGTSDSVSFSV